MARKRLTPANPNFLKPIKNADATITRLGTGAPIADVAGGAAQAAALEEVTNELTTARAEGRMVLQLPLDQVHGSWIIRDRMAFDADEMAALKASIREHGQRTPIEVVDNGAGQGDAPYGLISGFRRLLALRELFNETEDSRFGMVLALLRTPENAGDAYVAMIEENEIRTGLSYYERAAVAVNAVRAGVFDNEQAALRALYGNVSRAKRSKIKSFIELHHQLGDVLQFPTEIGERLGLAIVQALKASPELKKQLATQLKKTKKPSGEQKVLQAAIQAKKAVPAVVSEPQKIEKDFPDGTQLTMSKEGGQIQVKGAGVSQRLFNRINNILDHWSKG